MQVFSGENPCKVRVRGASPRPLFPNENNTPMAKAESKKGATSSHTIAAKGGCLQHNRRTQVAQNVYPERTHLNEAWESKKIADRKQLRGLKERAERLYTEKTGQKCQASFAPFRESCVVIKENSTMEEAKNFARMVEDAIPGIECLGIWIHRDEGHAKSNYIEGEDFQCNTHAHFLWCCQNQNTGKAIPMSRQLLRSMQDMAAEAFGMERGTPAAQTKRKHIPSLEYKLQAMQTQIDELQTALQSLSVAKEVKETAFNAIRGFKERLLSLFDESALQKQIKALNRTVDDLTKDNKALSAKLAESVKNAQNLANLYLSTSKDAEELRQELYQKKQEEHNRGSEQKQSKGFHR